MQKSELSILIPTYMGDCRRLVEELHAQAEAVAGLRYEIVVADDGSPDAAAVDRCREVGQLSHCRFIACEENRGRAAIRNFLAREASYAWLLFLDCDMSLMSSHFLESYLCQEGDVVYGGYCVRSDDSLRHLLRYRYERACLPQHTAERRRQRPYQHFHTCNFLVARAVMLAHPFDEQFRQYGYEDVLFGRRLREASIAVSHQELPVLFDRFESNAAFVAKTEQALQTLHDHRRELRGYSRLLTAAEGIHLRPVRALLRLGHRLVAPLERRWLCSRWPSLRVLQCYKLGYYLCLTKND